MVLGPVSRGSLLGALTAAAAGVGFVEMRKDPAAATDSDRWVRQTTAPDYRDRHVDFGFRHGLIRSSDHVLLVDDWADTGATVIAAKALVAAVGARWIGAACVVDALAEPRLRYELPLRALLNVREL